MTVLARLVNALRPAAEPLRPAVMRVGVGVYSALNNGRRRTMFRDLHRQDPGTFAPVGPVKVLSKPLPPRVADALFDAAQVTNALHTVGLGHRVTGPLNAALQVWTLSYRNSWGMIVHNDNMMVMHQAVLGVTPSADALSVDAWVRTGDLRPRGLDRAYGGVATPMKLATVAVYFLSGVAKVRGPMGWAWAGGRGLREQVAADAVRKETFGGEAPAAAGAVYRARGPIGLMSTGALIVELGAPLALLHPRLEKLFALAAWSMHWGIRVIMGIKFPYNLSGVSYLPFFPVGRQLP